MIGESPNIKYSIFFLIISLVYVVPIIVRKFN